LKKNSTFSFERFYVKLIMHPVQSEIDATRFLANRARKVQIATTRSWGRHN